MSSTNLIVVTKDLKSKFPVVKLEPSSTSADKVIPNLAGIHDDYWNPNTQISVNGVSFENNKMKIFVESRMEGEREFMRKLYEEFMSRTSHPSTGTTPGAITFRDELKSTFPVVLVK